MDEAWDNIPEDRIIDGAFAAGDFAAGLGGAAVGVGVAIIGVGVGDSAVFYGGMGLVVLSTFGIANSAISFSNALLDKSRPGIAEAFLGAITRRESGAQLGKAVDLVLG